MLRLMPRSAVLLFLASLLFTGSLAIEQGWGVSVDAQQRPATPGVAPLSLPAPEELVAQDADMPAARTFTVVGEGTVRIMPDIARTTIGVEAFGPAVGVAAAETASVMRLVLAAIMDQGVAERDIQTAWFSVWSEGNRVSDDGAPRSPIYRVSNTVMVTIRDLDRVSAVLDAAISAGANEVFGVNFAVGDPMALEAQATEQAIARANEKAQNLAALHGLEVGPVVSVSEIIGTGGGYYDSIVQRFEAPQGTGGAGMMPAVPGELSITKRIEVTYLVR
ncbi:MAG: SIMPL domain-containing protein [Chloroflexi bacterium]|nr:SIMPL domain-containing protein [Chloroflexota bacterium]